MQGVTSIASAGVTASTGALYLSRSAAGSTRRADSLVLKSSLFGSKGALLQDLAGSPRKSVKVDDGVARKGKAFQVRAATNPLGVFNKVENLVKGIVHQPTHQQEAITYKGIARIAKKRASVSNIVQADLLDLPAAFGDKAAELVGQKIEIQLVSVDLNRGTEEPKLSQVSPVEGWITNLGDLDFVSDEDDYAITFKVPADFGEIGAFVIKNNHPNEFFLKDLRLQGPDGDTISFKTLAWIHPHKRYKGKDRVFFTSKTFLPSETPAGLVALRNQELQQMRGDGTGKREPWDRIYDYDVYNDIGKPDSSGDLKRPVLGDSYEFPFPRRMRTGRPPSKKDPKSESRLSSDIEVPYIPSDEFFLRTKNSTFIAGALKGVAHSILPSIAGSTKGGKPFKSLNDISELYRNGLPISIPESTLSSDLTAEQDAQKGDLVYFSDIFAPKGENKSVINYPTPQVVEQNERAWETDQEYGRQALAGLNPSVIRLVKEYPPKSALNPQEYGDGTSLTDEHILPYLGGQTVAQAIKSKKLFTIDYHDTVLPYTDRANAENAGKFKSYAPRTIFVLKEGQMKPIAIELSKPPTSRGGKASNRVFTPADERDHLWTLAKLHASSIDSSYHQVVSHFTFTHATLEPFVIASNRRLSKLHPIRSLLQPHFKDTLAINSGAREALIDAGGIIEECFSFGRYSMELGSKGYGAFWQFDTLGLPGDLLSRGMAEPADESSPGSVKLVVEDYPYAKDGLEIWDALYKWVEKYCDIAYKGSDEAVKKDKEIQAWWDEIVNVGHGDHKEASWWPKLDSIKSLAHIVTSIAWIAGPFHASVNFGQYAYSGYPLNKPTATRKFIPEKNSPEYDELQKDPVKFILSGISNSKEVTQVLTVLELLVTHSVDEEYIGASSMSTDWTGYPKIAAAFREFSDRIATIADNIKQRNKDTTLVNRSGPAKIPYTLLYPTSTTGLTGRGVPYSISI